MWLLKDENLPVACYPLLLEVVNVQEYPTSSYNKLIPDQG
jgi:hypothetical protein